MKKYNCILLVDDDLISCFLNKEILTTLKVTDHIHTASNGEEALHFIVENRKKQNPCPDLIFLDINMPAMDGFQFLSELQKLQEGQLQIAKIIILTSSNSPIDRNLAAQYHISGYINKPLTGENLEVFLT